MQDVRHGEDYRRSYSRDLPKNNRRTSQELSKAVNDITSEAVAQLREAAPFLLLGVRQDAAPPRDSDTLDGMSFASSQLHRLWLFRMWSGSGPNPHPQPQPPACRATLAALGNELRAIRQEMIALGLTGTGTERTTAAPPNCPPVASDGGDSLRAAVAAWDVSVLLALFLGSIGDLSATLETAIALRSHLHREGTYNVECVAAEGSSHSSSAGYLVGTDTLEVIRLVYSSFASPSVAAHLLSVHEAQSDVAARRMRQASRGEEDHGGDGGGDLATCYPSWLLRCSWAMAGHILARDVVGLWELLQVEIDFASPADGFSCCTSDAPQPLRASWASPHSLIALVVFLCIREFWGNEVAGLDRFFRPTGVPVALKRYYLQAV